MVVNLCVAHKKTDSCAAHEYGSCAAHEYGSCAAHKIELACSTQKLTRVTHEFGLSHSTKIQEYTRSAARECQLRCERYRICMHS